MLRVPEGRHVGQPVVLRDWQREIIHGVYDSPTRRAIISFGRKNGKTAISAMLLLVHLCGPRARQNSQLYSAAQSLEQAGVLFGLAAKMVRMSPDLSAYVNVKDTLKALHCSELGTVYRALSADASTAFGLSPVFTVHDELGQVRGPRSSLYEALETGSAAHDNPLSICISTQAPKDDDLLSVLIDDAARGEDPKVKLFLYTASLDDDPFDEATIRRANPAFGDFQNATEVLAQAADARRMPSRENEYRNLILNQRVEMQSPFVSRGVWKSCEAAPLMPAGVPVFIGLDLSAAADLTAAVCVARDESDCWHVVPSFWAPEGGVLERARRDRVPYDVWARDGKLNLTPGGTVDYDFVARWLLDTAAAVDVQIVAFDRWRIDVFKAALQRQGATEDMMARLQPFGQGFASMGPALDVLEAALLNGRLAHGGHPVLTMCAANAIVQRDPAGNRKLTKAKSTGRIDGMVALAMAIAAGQSWLSAGADVFAEAW